MKKSASKILALVLSLTTLFTSFSLNVFALKSPNATDTQSELHQMGLTDADILRLYDISNQLVDAKSSREVSQLMEQYHAIVDETLYASAVGSIYSKRGGTLTLNYTGSLSSVSNIIYTKVVYMPAEQVEFYQRAMSQPGFVDWAKSEIVGMVTSKYNGPIKSYQSFQELS